MDHPIPHESFIIPQIQISLFPKQESSSSLSSSSKLLLHPRIYVDFGVRNLTLACSTSNDNNGGWELVSKSGDEQLVTYPTMGLILHDNFVYKERIWLALTYLRVEERFFEQVVETLEEKVGQVFTDMSGYVVEPGFDVEFHVHVSFVINRVSGQNDGLSLEDGDEDIMSWADQNWPVEWLE